jgi:hypothetical protein
LTKIDKVESKVGELQIPLTLIFCWAGILFIGSVQAFFNNLRRFCGFAVFQQQPLGLDFFSYGPE